MTILALGRRRLTVQFRVERTSVDDTQSLEALHRRRLAMREADSRASWWEIERRIHSSRMA